MDVDASIVGKNIYAAGSSSVNIRQSVTTNSPIMGNATAGSVLGVATGNIFWDVDTGKHRWYQIEFSGGKGYVREDVVKLSKPAGTVAGNTSSGSSSGNASGEHLKTVFDTETTGLPKWAIAAIIVSFMLVGVAIWFLVKKKKGRK